MTPPLVLRQWCPECEAATVTVRCLHCAGDACRSCGGPCFCGRGAEDDDDWADDEEDDDE